MIDDDHNNHVSFGFRQIGYEVNGEVRPGPSGCGQRLELDYW